MPKKFPLEFKRDVVRVARRGDLSAAEVAADFDISVESERRRPEFGYRLLADELEREEGRTAEAQRRQEGRGGWSRQVRSESESGGGRQGGRKRRLRCDR